MFDHKLCSLMEKVRDDFADTISKDRYTESMTIRFTNRADQDQTEKFRVEFVAYPRDGMSVTLVVRYTKKEPSVSWSGKIIEGMFGYTFEVYGLLGSSKFGEFEVTYYAANEIDALELVLSDFILFGNHYYPVVE